MTRYWITPMAALLAALAGDLPAAGLGDTLGASGRFALGLGYERINDQDLDLDGGNFSSSVLGVPSSGGFPELGDQVIDAQLDGSRWFLEGILGLHPRIDAFVKLGGAGFDADYRLVEPGFSDQAYQFDGDTDFSFGLGLRAKLFEHENGLRVMGRLVYTHSDASADVKIDGLPLSEAFAGELIDSGATQVSASGSGDVELREWRAALVVGKSYGGVTPYAGVEYRYTDLRLDARVDGNEALGAFAYSLHQKYEAADAVGLLLGVDARFGEHLALGAELGFIYGTTVRLGAEWRF